MVHQAMALGAGADCRMPTAPGPKAACSRHKLADVRVAVTIPGPLITPIVTPRRGKEPCGDRHEMKDAGRARPATSA